MEEKKLIRHSETNHVDHWGSTSHECTTISGEKLEQLAGISPRSVQIITFSPQPNHRSAPQFHSLEDGHFYAQEFESPFDLQVNQQHHNQQQHNNHQYEKLPFLPLDSQEMEATNKGEVQLYHNQGLNMNEDCYESDESDDIPPFATSVMHKYNLDKDESTTGKELTNEKAQFEKAQFEKVNAHHLGSDVQDVQSPILYCVPEQNINKVNNSTNSHTAMNSTTNEQKISQKHLLDVESVSKAKTDDATSNILVSTKCSSNQDISTPFMQHSRLKMDLGNSSSYIHSNLKFSTTESRSVDSNSNNTLLVDNRTSDIISYQVGEDSIPPFAFTSIISNADKSSHHGKEDTNLAIKSIRNNTSSINSKIVDEDNAQRHSKFEKGPSLVIGSQDFGQNFNLSSLARSSDNPFTKCCSHSQPGLIASCSDVSSSYSSVNNSMNFSNLMRQADNKEPTLGSPLFRQMEKRTTDSNDSDNRKDTPSSFRNTFKNSVILPAASFTKSILKKRNRMVVNNISQDSFQVTVLLSPNVSVRDVVDVVANPDMLRFWCEPISALVVTEHKGGSLGSTSPPSSSHSGTKSTENCYSYPDVEEFDDDVIVPPAEPMIERRIPDKEREQYDGEWIKASTPELVLPHSHTTFLNNCLKNVSTFLGFPGYGNVTMFIERNSAQVNFTLGPFNGGSMLSHKIVVSEEASGQGVVLMDEVTVRNPEDESDDDWLLCSCLESVRDITRQWYSASLDGYIEQTRASLMNLIDLVDRGGESRAYEEMSFYDADSNHDASQRRPLLG